MTPSQIIALEAKNKMADFMGKFITDDELRNRFGDKAELLIDALDRNLPTQKGYNWTRDRAEVEKVIKARGYL